MADNRPRSKRGRRALTMSIAAAAFVTALVGVGTAPAMAWGSVKVGAPGGCTGSASGNSWISGPTAHAETGESGNICLVIVPVSAGLRHNGDSTLWNGSTGVSYDHVTASQIAYGYDGGWHRWGAKVAS